MPKLSGSSDNLIFVDPSPVARRLLWHLFSIGSRRLVQADHHERFEKPGAHLFWVQSGEGELEYRSSRFELRRGRKIWLVDMGKPRTYIPATGRHLTITGFRFRGPGLEFWHEEFHGEENPEFPMGDFQVVARVYRELLRLTRRRPTGWEWQVHLRITDVLGRLLMSRELLASPHSELPPPVKRVINAIAANPLRDWKAQELAGIGKVSYSGLRALFQHAGQGTIHQHIQRARLDQARLLLADKRLSVKDVATQLSFSSEFYFSHFFRRHTGMSPTEFRQHLKA
ncbi:MAG: helix-turn-helix transcriptional regulator [Verrucomicrobiota bacterium]|nr:helix-turn-helix transcriptional regulator [Verrucomicrobiota bacterium]